MSMTLTASPEVKPRWTLRRIRHAGAAVVVRAMAAMFTWLPRPVTVAMGRALGSAAYPILRRQRRIAHANLDIVFGPAMTRTQKRRIAREAFASFGGTVFGLLSTPRLTAGNIDRWACLCPRSAALLRRAREEGRGFILAVPHYGDWELLSVAMGYWGYPYMAVGADTGNRAVGRFVERMRTLSGHVLVPPRYAMLKLFKHLKRGGSVAMIVDANVPRRAGGIWLDFFSLPVFNSHAPVELALRCGAMILFGYVRRLPDGRSELVLEEVQQSASGDRDADVRATSQRLLDHCAALIRAHPEPWLWTYRRWRRRPTRETGRFPFYSRFDGASDDRQVDPPTDPLGTRDVPERGQGTVVERHRPACPTASSTSGAG